ncbi:DUF2726 domain-containing protein [Ottowia sp.]|uniref:DUF2726 domain-containing protein n=1 Tax=Ottowia sp. TaxID=1898956 RepID=UPI0025EB2766|nr:DUF2726 domain-containing protein [Ottowia sp.]MBK6616658.1 DUF2726 domain-containing protein [Ottowia sp.]
MWEAFGIAVFLAVCAFGLTFVWLNQRERKKAEPEWPFQLAHDGRLMTDAEWNVYERLSAALPNCQVFCQVSMGQLLEVKEGSRKVEKGQPNWRYKIDKKALDFVVCDKASGKVLAVIELDDASHEQEERRRADEEKDRALEAAGVKIFRWTMRTLPKAAEIEKSIRKASRRDGEYSKDDEEVEPGLPVLA